MHPVWRAGRRGTERGLADADRPWFVWLAFNLSHATRTQRPSAMAVPDLDTLNPESLAEMQACGAEFGTNHPGACSGESLMRAMTGALDTVVGRLIDVVDELDPNTYIIYIGDNGTAMYGRPNLDFIDNMYITRNGRGKGTAYESGVRVPMIVRGPGVQARGRSDAYVHAADIFSTSLALAGLEPPAEVPNSEGTRMLPLDAVSLTPILDRSTDHVRDPERGYLMTETSNLMTGGTLHAGARNATHKVVCLDGVSPESCQFYDLEADPLEEFPLDIPESCHAYREGTWAPQDEAWHYCRLTDVLATQSFLE